MVGRTIPMPEEALVNMLKTLPEDELIEIFWKTLIESDVSPLTEEEKEAIEEGRIEFKKGETFKWEDLR